jgi:outer membrane lipoprotein-sorting protein
MQFRLTLIVLGIVVSSPSCASTEPLADVLENMIAAYGGEDNVQKLDSMVQEWDLLALTRNRQGTDKRSIRLPDRLKVELVYPEKLETRVLDGDAAYAIFDDREPAAASDMQIVKVVGTLAINGTKMQFVTEYSEFAMVDGVLVHHRENKFVGNTNTAVLKLRRVELNVEFDEDEFAPRRNESGPIVARLTSVPASGTK